MSTETLCPEGRPQCEAPFLEFGGTLPDGTRWASCCCGMVHYRRSNPWFAAAPEPTRPWWRRYLPGGTR